MIRTTVDIDLRPTDAPIIAVQPRGHRSQTATTAPHVELTLPDVTIALPVEDAQRLALDLVEALALIRKPRPVAQDGGE